MHKIFICMTYLKVHNFGHFLCQIFWIYWNIICKIQTLKFTTSTCKFSTIFAFQNGAILYFWPMESKVVWFFVIWIVDFTNFSADQIYPFPCLSLFPSSSMKNTSFHLKLLTERCLKCCNTCFQICHHFSLINSL